MALTLSVRLPKAKAVFVSSFVLLLHVIPTLMNANTECMERFSSILISSPYIDVFLDGNMAYTVNFWGMEVFDISDPENPASIGNFDTPGAANDIYIKDNYAYVTDASAGLHILDVSVPSSATWVSSFETCGGAVNVFVRDNYACVAEGDSGFQIIDVSNPLTPRLVGTYSYGKAVSVYVVDNYAYVAGGWDNVIDASEFSVVDISDPSHPMLVGSYRCEKSGIATGVVVDDNYAYLSVENIGLRILDVYDPQNPVLVGKYDEWSIHDVYKVANILYMTLRSGWFLVIEVSNPHKPALLGGCDLGYNSLGFGVDGHWACISRWEDGIGVVDVSVSETPVLVGGYVPEGWPVDIFTIGKYAYVAKSYNGFQIVDVSDPGNPALLGACRPTTVEALWADGDYAYICGSSALVAIDVSDPLNPIPVMDHYVSGPHDVMVIDKYVHVACDYGLKVFESSLPDSLTLVGSCRTSEAHGVYVSNNFAYIADWHDGLKIIDVSVPSSPTLIGSLDTDGYAVNVFVSDGYAFVADGSGGMDIIDVSQSSNPLLIRNYNDILHGMDVWVENGYAYVCDAGGSDDSNGIRVIDITNPFNPTLICKYDGGADPRKIFLSNGHIYLADTYALSIFSVHLTGIENNPNTQSSVVDSREFELYQNYPNPFNSNTEIRFQILEKSGENSLDSRLSSLVSLRIYNILGQEIKILMDEEIESGSYEIIWDGNDSDGSPVSSGIYFYQLNRDGYTQTNKMILLR